MKIYTRTGDDGETGLFGGQRVPKTHPRVAAYGDVDELNSVLGLAVAALDGGASNVSASDGAASGDSLPGKGGLAGLRESLEHVQARLFDVGADLATPPDTKAAGWVRRVRAEWAAGLEVEIDAMEAGLAPLTSFILPGGSPPAAALHLARTVCRRAERSVLAAQAAGEKIDPPVTMYLNRLSDWLFTAARWANAAAGVAESPWRADRDAAGGGRSEPA